MPQTFDRFLTYREQDEEKHDLAGLTCFPQCWLRFNDACTGGQDFCDTMLSFLAGLLSAFVPFGLAPVLIGRAKFGVEKRAVDGRLKTKGARAIGPLRPSTQHFVGLVPNRR